MEFVKFYIVQLVKSAAARIRLTDKEKEKLLSKLVSKIENSRDLFPDLKTMERVAELEEAASKLISIYRRLNKTHIDLEKISYQFLSDRDSIQSILRRFVQGNYRTGIVSRKRPKIVFDDTTFTIYELKEQELTEQEEKSHEHPKEPRIELNEFLKDEKEEIVAIKKEEIETQIDGKEASDAYENFSEEKKNTFDLDEDMQESLEIDNGIAQKSIEKKSRTKKDEADDLVLPLQFEDEKTMSETERTQENELDSRIEKVPVQENQLINEQLEDIKQEEFEEKFTPLSPQEETQSITLVESELNFSEAGQETAPEQIDESFEKDLSVESFKKEEDEISEESSDETETISKVIQINHNDLTGALFLDFEKLILDNILHVDEFLTKALTNKASEEDNLKLIVEAQKCLQYAKDLQHDVVSDLINVYLVSLIAIKDHKIIIDNKIADLIRSTMILVVSLVKNREIDLEPFIKKHNLLKAKLQQLQYEV